MRVDWKKEVGYGRKISGSSDGALHIDLVWMRCLCLSTKASIQFFGAIHTTHACRLHFTVILIYFRRPITMTDAQRHNKKKDDLAIILSAVWTGLEPATPCVTGRYSNQLNYHTPY